MTDHPSALVSVPEADWQHVIGALKNAQARLPLGAAIGNVSDALAKVEHLKAAPAAPQAAGAALDAWRDFEGDHLTDGKGNASAETYRLCRAAFDAGAALRAPSRKPESGAVDDLVDRFAAALKDKLRAAEAKYGHDDAWMRDDWRDDLVYALCEHIEKGDPRDVAAYCAFAWHHGWSLALATREEAPAGAGPVCLEIPLSNHMRVTLEYGPDGSRTATLWNEANELIADGDAPSLRAQPQAREDAPPVRWGWRVRSKPSKTPSHRPWHWQADEPTGITAELCEWEQVYATHPAPDALRVREDVAREIKAWADTRWPKSHGVGSKGWVDGLTNRVLAALQAEQGAK